MMSRPPSLRLGALTARRFALRCTSTHRRALSTQAAPITVEDSAALHPCALSHRQPQGARTHTANLFMTRLRGRSQRDRSVRG